MITTNFGQTRVRIQEAANHLVTASGDLRDRFPRAYFLFARAGCDMPTEQMNFLYKEIQVCLRNLKQGDYSHITNDELENAAEIIMEMNRLSIIDAEAMDKKK